LVNADQIQVKAETAAVKNIVPLRPSHRFNGSVSQHEKTPY
jgi:hypothetical protein